jgi:hypothetical protein
MSASLYWRPSVPDPEGESFGYSLKWALVKRLGWNNDGSCNTDWATVDARLVPWLEGIRDGGGDVADDAKILLGLIERYGEVEIRIWNG